MQSIKNPQRQVKKEIMKNLGLKSGKQFRKWLKESRRLEKEIKYAEEKKSQEDPGEQVR